MDQQWNNLQEVKIQEVKTRQAASPGSGGFFKKLYWGEYSLARTFWLYYFLVTFLIGLLQSAFAATVVGMLLSVALGIFGLVYSVLCVVGIWRAASKYTGFKLWAVLAKIYVVLCIIGFVLTLIAFLALV